LTIEIVSNFGFRVSNLQLGFSLFSAQNLKYLWIDLTFKIVLKDFLTSFTT